MKSILTIALFAAIGIIELPYGETVEVAEPQKVLAIECLSSVASGTYTPKKETLLMGEEAVVTPHAFTNFTYSVVTTNSLGVATTNVLDRPHPMPLPDVMTAYWTNTVVTGWSETNMVPIVSATLTNAVEASSFLAPGDKLFCPAANTFRGKLKIYTEL